MPVIFWAVPSRELTYPTWVGSYCSEPFVLFVCLFVCCWLFCFPNDATSPRTMPTLTLRWVQKARPAPATQNSTWHGSVWTIYWGSWRSNDPYTNTTKSDCPCFFRSLDPRKLWRSKFSKFSVAVSMIGLKKNLWKTHNTNPNKLKNNNTKSLGSSIDYSWRLLKFFFLVINAANW